MWLTELVFCRPQDQKTIPSMEEVVRRALKPSGSDLTCSTSQFAHMKTWYLRVLPGSPVKRERMTAIMAHPVSRTLDLETTSLRIFYREPVAKISGFTCTLYFCSLQPSWSLARKAPLSPDGQI